MLQLILPPHLRLFLQNRQRLLGVTLLQRLRQLARLAPATSGNGRLLVAAQTSDAAAGSLASRHRSWWSVVDHLAGDGGSSSAACWAGVQ